ncbi:unnamed protein product [Clonostachys byssicola]|uniref:Uncharacterized protein n=1 Tax=Clonostachys byssicola TaxID=160290 RepID=A0A9N9Y0Y8_9HYPO|nr:unnamed protein product [Clonostachys byssicola]
MDLEALQQFLNSNASFSILPQEHDTSVSSSNKALQTRMGQLNPTFAPRSYNLVPWPDDMLASSERRFLWRYFISIIESEYLCADWEDVGHFYNFQHPYTTTLPGMALSNAALRGAILCFSASQYELKHKQKAFDRTKMMACSQAVQSMRHQIVTGADDEQSLLSMIFAASILHYFGPERHNYLRIASNLVPRFLSKWKPHLNTPTTYPEVSLTEFRWGLITSLCSLQQPGPPLDDLTYRMIEMSEREINQKFSQAFESWVSHPIFMFSPRLINPLLRIGRLLEKQLLRLHNPAPQGQDLSWETEVAEVEEMLLCARECDVNVLQSAPGCGDPANVLALNEAMYAACAILLYARIHGVPFTAPFVRRQTQLVVDEISKIDVKSRVSYAIVFPLFVAGCEAVEPQARMAIRERLQNPQGVSYDRGDMVGSLDHIWEIRDLRPGLLWPQWVAELEPRYRVSCLM